MAIRNKPSDADTERNRQIMQRTKEARLAVNLSQKEVADRMSITEGRYQKWETRAPMPPRFYAPFAAAVLCDVKWLITGEAPPQRQLGKKKAKSPDWRNMGGDILQSGSDDAEPPDQPSRLPSRKRHLR